MIQDDLSEKRLRDLLRAFTYRPGWKFTIENGNLIIRATVVDTDNPKQTTPLSFGVTIPSFVPDYFDWTHWLFNQIMTVEDHEAREFFKVDGIKVYDPHG